MRVLAFLTVCGIGILALSCSSEPDYAQTYISGEITVADSVDNSGNYEGIGLTILKKDSANADADTLFHEVTDSSGSFGGTARFDQKRRYPLIISRNNNNIAQIAIILADQDTVRITGELPSLDKTLEIDSREHDAMEVFHRVDRGFQRLLRYAQAGRISKDSLDREIDKWNDLYWEVYTDNRGTFASELAASASIRLLNGWKPDKMMNRIRKIQDQTELVGVAASYGKDYLAEREGLDYTIQYLDTLLENAGDKEVAMRVKMEKIKLLYDSARIDRAKEQLAAFREQHSENNAAESWAESITYDLNYLSPGDTIPSFSFGENGKTISRDSLMGTPYILEISTLSNPLYQQQYDRTVVIHSIYKNFGLQIVTIPLDESQVTVNAFFEERVQPWPVASAQDFDRKQLLEKFNIQLVPTRFLIDREGRIVRKYIGREFEDVIQGIQTITNKKEEAS